MINKLSPAARLFGLLALSSAITLALHRMEDAPWLSVDWSNLRQWLDTTPPLEPGLLSAVRVVGLGCGWWIILSTCLYLTARLSRQASALRLATPFTLPFVRRLGARVVGAVAFSTLGGSLPTLAASDQPLVDGQLDSYPVPLVVPHFSLVASQDKRHPSDSVFLPISGVKLQDQTRLAAGNPAHPAEPSGGGVGLALSSPIRPGEEYRILNGDHLWSIADRSLSQSMPHPPTPQQTASYWMDLIDTNREAIRSQDPNLVYPDEIILLPEIREF